MGGGAAGLIAAVRLARSVGGVAVAERNSRVGKKLAATGNGQGNVTNSEMTWAHFRSSRAEFPRAALSRFGYAEAEAFYRSVGIFLTKGRGRSIRFRCRRRP